MDLRQDSFMVWLKMSLQQNSLENDAVNDDNQKGTHGRESIFFLTLAIKT
jgi:hypothetical protein